MQELLLRRLVVVEGEALVGGVAEAGGDDHDRAGGEERSGDGAAHHLALTAGEVDGEPGGGGRRRRREEGAAEGEDVEAARHGDDGARSSAGMTDADVGDAPGGAEHAHAHLAATREPGDAVDDVAAGGDLQDVGAQGAGAVTGDDHGRLGLVLGPRGAATRAAHHQRVLLLLLVAVAAPRLLVRARDRAVAAPVAPGAVDGVVAVVPADTELLLVDAAGDTAPGAQQLQLALLLLEMLERRVLLPREQVVVVSA